MKRCGTILACLALWPVLSAALRADEIALANNPYGLVVVRNIFSLNPPPPPADPNPPPDQPSVKITPTGIMSFMGQSQVLFKASGGGKAGDQSYILGEGQAEDEIEVVKIDQKAGIVTFNNHGVRQELQLANTTAASSSAPSAPTVMGFRPAPALPGFAPVGHNNAPNNPFNASANSAANFPTPTGFGGASSGANNPNNGFNMSFGANTHNSTAPAQQQAPVDPDVQKVLIVANHLKALQDGAPEAAIFPPTDLDEPAGVPSNVSPAPSPTDTPPPQP
jgi:hypothetical protein